MKLFIYSRARTLLTGEIWEWCVAAPDKFGYTWALNDEYADAIEAKYGQPIPAENRYSRITAEDVDGESFMVSVGGDGTLLEAVGRLRGLPMPVIGVNMGRMGFLANISPARIDSAFTDIFAGRYNIEQRTMLRVEGDFGAVQPEFPCALNEFTIHRHTADMAEVAVYSEGKLLTIVRGDGVIASTPTGSTAYSLSAGGPLVAPDCACVVYSAIAPHNFSIRPMVVPDTSVVTFEVRTRDREALASLDNTSFLVGDGARFVIKKAEFSAFLMQIQNISFYDTLRDRTMWGVDRRDALSPGVR
ncbi:MAG: NAD(+)/NADH kinase [Alistipes sp.]|jgi:NAD+ kinase|nr:NAD(+)/NADH kinase [Alistipes sp.]